MIKGSIFFGGVFNMMTAFLDSIDRLIALEDEIVEEQCSVELRKMVIEASCMTLLKSEETKKSCATSDLKLQYEEAANAYISSLSRFACDEMLFQAKRVLAFKQYEREKSLLTS